MKISVAQALAKKADIKTNIVHHVNMIKVAADCGADMIIFPELSLTGYEAELAETLAMKIDDERLDAIQSQSDSNNIIVCAGAPIKCNEKCRIGMIVFQPGATRQLYTKQYLHSDEFPYFSAGDGDAHLSLNLSLYFSPERQNRQPFRIALAICYELSVDEHTEKAFSNGADVYIVSAVKDIHSIDKSHRRLQHIASTYSTPTLLSNSIGHSGGYDCAGKSSAWNSKGEPIAQLSDDKEGLLIFDTETQQTESIYI